VHDLLESVAVDGRFDCNFESLGSKLRKGHLFKIIGISAFSQSSPSLIKQFIDSAIKDAECVSTDLTNPMKRSKTTLISFSSFCSQQHATIESCGLQLCRSFIAALLAVSAGTSVGVAADLDSAPGSNPIFRDMFTADPAPLVVGDTLYVYVGHDDAKDGEMFNMKEWLCYSTKDLKQWTAHGPIMKPTDFKWAVSDAWAAQMVKKNGKYYFYTTVTHDRTHPGKAIGVAVSDSPTGPFKDARGSALVTEQDTPSPYGWDDIDPTVLIDEDGTAWMAWGNPNCHLAKLKQNMTEIDGPIQSIHVPNYTEGPWLDKRNGLYYLFYPAFAHQGMGEKICYATAKVITGPWVYRGILTGGAKGSYTIHPGVVDFKGQTLFFYHNATLTLDGVGGALGRRSVCAEYLFYNPDGTIQPILQTKEGLSLPPKRNAGKPDQVVSMPVVPDLQVKVTQELAADPTMWPGSPVLKTVENPYDDATKAVSFNSEGLPSCIGQTFKMESDLRLERVVLYAGDGSGASSDEPTTLALYELNEGNASPDSYSAETNLLNSGRGWKISYTPQARGLLQIDFSEGHRVELKKGRVYALELQGKPGSAPIFWRRSTKEIYPNGASYSNRKRLKDRENFSDFAFALYGAQS
jgi:Glycosyl hydrolases family 43